MLDRPVQPATTLDRLADDSAAEHNLSGILAFAAVEHGGLARSDRPLRRIEPELRFVGGSARKQPGGRGRPIISYLRGYGKRSLPGRQAGKRAPDAGVRDEGGAVQLLIRADDDRVALRVQGKHEQRALVARRQPFPLADRVERDAGMLADGSPA